MEFQRVYHKRFWALFAVLVAANLFLFFYQQTRELSLAERKSLNRQKQMLIERYGEKDSKKALELLGRDLEEIRQFIRAAREGADAASTSLKAGSDAQSEKAEQGVRSGQSTYDTASGADDSLLEYYLSLNSSEQNRLMKMLGTFKTHLEYLDTYPQKVEQVIQNAEYLKTFSIFSDVNSYEYNNIIKTAKDFSRISKTTPVLANDEGTEAFLSYRYSFYLALPLLVYVVYRLFLERDNGMWPLVYGCQKRLKLALCRLGILASAVVVVLANLYFSVFILSQSLYDG